MRVLWYDLCIITSTWPLQNMLVSFYTIEWNGIETVVFLMGSVWSFAFFISQCQMHQCRFLRNKTPRFHHQMVRHFTYQKATACLIFPFVFYLCWLFINSHFLVCSSTFLFKMSSGDVPLRPFNTKDTNHGTHAKRPVCNCFFFFVQQTFLSLPVLFSTPTPNG